MGKITFQLAERRDFKILTANRESINSSIPEYGFFGPRRFTGTFQRFFIFFSFHKCSPRILLRVFRKCSRSMIRIVRKIRTWKQQSCRDSYRKRFFDQFAHENYYSFLSVFVHYFPGTVFTSLPRIHDLRTNEIFERSLFAISHRYGSIAALVSKGERNCSTVPPGSFCYENIRLSELIME